MRPAWAEVDLDAIAHNVDVLRRAAHPARLCAVVKADGYGHGAVPVAHAAVAAGADVLAVALVEEGVALRDAGIEAPILLLSEPPADDLADAFGNNLIVTLYTVGGIEAASAAVRRANADDARLRVHLKVDTGMHRVGAAPTDACALAEKIEASPELDLHGIFTHCAVADEPDHPYTATQLASFETVLADLAAVGIRPPVRHAANSAATLRLPESRYDLVRCGIALYGLSPAPALDELPAVAELRPVLSLKADVSLSKQVDAGERLSYGLRYLVEQRSTIATVPIGYADGVRRRLPAVGGEVLIGGKRRLIAGTVTMDQITVDCGNDSVQRGDEVVLIGSQGNEHIRAEEWAQLLDTIGYEIVCGIGPRVPRRYVSRQADHVAKSPAS